MSASGTVASRLKIRSLIAVPLAVIAVVAATVLPAIPAAAAAPTFTSLSPTSGPLKQSVTITGTGFTSPATVMFNGHSTTGTVASSTRITAAVPPSASSGPVTVTTAGSTIAAGTFTVTTSISLVGATAGPPGSTLSVYGAGFAAGEAVDLYAGTADQALIVATSSGNFAYAGFTISASAKPGNFVITAVGRKSGLAAQATYKVRTDWNRTGYDNASTSRNQYENAITKGNVEDLDDAWTAPTTAGGPGLYSGTVVAGGIAYVATFDRKLFAFDAETGASKWTYTIPGSASGSAQFLVSGGVLYLASFNGDLIALTASSGALKWIQSIGAPGVGSTPVQQLLVTGTTVIASNGSNLVGRSTSTGGALWTDALTATVSAGPVLVGGKVAVGQSDGTLVLVDPTTGAKINSTSMMGSISGLAGASGFVYAGTESGVLAAYSVKTGLSQEWSDTIGGTALAFAVNGSKVFVRTSGTSSDTIGAYSSADGSVLWTRNSSGYSFDRVAPVIANGVLYQTSLTANFVAYDASSGAVLAKISAGDGSGLGYNPPTVVNGVVYVQSTFGPLTALRLPAIDTANARVVIKDLKPNTALKLQKSTPVQ